MLVAAALIGLAFGAIVPGLLTLADQQSPRQRTSAVMATFFTFLDMGLGIGAYLVGVCLPLFGYANLYLVLGFLVLGVGLFYYKFVYKKEQAVWACP
jgi:predicted MFS family arabinose efflux permease